MTTTAQVAVVASPQGATHRTAGETSTACGAEVSTRWGWTPRPANTYISCRRCQTIR